MTGQAAVQPDGKAPQRVVPGAGRKRFWAELDSLRSRMRARGFGHDEIAAEMSRRNRLRLREAYRLAWGWSLEEVAARFNEHASGHPDAEPQEGLTGARLSQVEHWPDGGRKPSVHMLFVLAEIYQTDVVCLLDFADHEGLPQRDLLVLLRRPRAETPFGEKVVALMDAAGLSVRETARRVSCSAGYLSNVIHGRRRPSARVTERLEQVLSAGGELTVLARTAQIVVPEDAAQPASRHRGRGTLPGVRVAPGDGFSLSVQYVPGRLVIEVSDPAGGTSQLAAGGGDHAVTGELLTLVPATGSRAHQVAGR